MGSRTLRRLKGSQVSKYIKLNLFVPKEEIEAENNFIVESWIRLDKIIMMQDTTKAQTEYKSFLSIEGLEDGVRAMESVEEIIHHAQKSE